MSALRVVKSADFDLSAVRKDFPALHQKVHGKQLVYLDNAATTQKPMAVIEALNRFYKFDCSNVHRAVHALSDRATKAYEGARTIVKQFINARSEREIIFVRGATEAINLVMNSFGRPRLVHRLAKTAGPTLVQARARSAGRRGGANCFLGRIRRWTVAVS